MIAAHARPELTVRAILTGMVIGAVLTPCNVYSGLKIGWSFNMSVAAGLIAYALWGLSARAAGTRPLSLLENNINQTTASSAASIISSGLAAPIPALALVTGQTLAWPALVIWLFVVSMLGVVVAAGLRNQMLVREHLAFPSGVVTAETMQDIHSGGAEAAGRLRLLGAGAVFAAALKFTSEFITALPRLAPDIRMPFSRVAEGGVRQGDSASFANLGLSLDPSLLMVGFGAIAGLRVGVSALLGAVLAWAVLAPMALERGWAQPGAADADASWFAPLVEWLLWPGATLMTVAAITSVLISLGRMALRRRAQISAFAQDTSRIDPRFVVAGFACVLAASVTTQTQLFAITPFEAVFAVLFSFVLAVVSARVSGETGVTPVGALGKITQLTFGVISPGNATSNLMSANVTGGAADQCADLLHDLRTGQIIGATPGFQIIAQLFGVLTGSLAGAFTYLALITDPQAQLITPEWPAPAVATWKAVAEVLIDGLDSMPGGALEAMLIAFAAAVVLACAEKFAPERIAHFIPSAPAMGLAFVIPAWNSISLFIGAAGAAVISHFFPDWAGKRLVVLAAGLIVGESLAGVVSALVAL